MPETFHVRIRGHGQDQPVDTVSAKDDKAALKKCLKHVKSFALPGWEMYVVETKTAIPVVPGGHTRV